MRPKKPTFRPLYAFGGGLVRAFECLLCPHRIEDRTSRPGNQGTITAKVGEGRRVLTTARGIKLHLLKVHGVKI